MPDHRRARPIEPPASPRLRARWDRRDLDHLWRTLQAINEWARFADAKAAAILAANGVLGTLAAGLIEGHWELPDGTRTRAWARSWHSSADWPLRCIVVIRSASSASISPAQESSGECSLPLGGVFHHVAHRHETRRRIVDGDQRREIPGPPRLPRGLVRPHRI